MIRFSDTDVKNNLGFVLKEIKIIIEKLEQTRTHP
jgi:very-short-patch-repair endonuclease